MVCNHSLPLDTHHLPGVESMAGLPSQVWVPSLHKPKQGSIVGLRSNEETCGMHFLPRLSEAVLTCSPVVSPHAGGSSSFRTMRVRVPYSCQSRGVG